MRKVAAFLLLLPMLGVQAQETKSSVTFTKDVAPLFFKYCASCHRSGEVAPFPLMEYGDVKKRAKQLLTAIESRQMPPWKPSEGYGHFMGERRMKSEEIDTVRAWVQQGLAEGDAKDLPPTPKFAEGWAYGEPDLVVKMPDPYTVPAEGRDIIRAFWIPLNLPETRFVSAVQIRCRNLQVVHHAVLYVDPVGESRRKDEADPEPGFDGNRIGLSAVSGGILSSWLPGGIQLPLPDGMGKDVKKKCDLVLQLHFNPIGKAVKEEAQIGFWFLKEPPRRLIATVPLFQSNINLPPDQKDLLIKDKYVLPVDVDMIGIRAHAHNLAREVKIWGKDPEGREIPILWIKDWDFAWQEQYRFKELIRLKKGTELHMHWIYDNTTGNPKNPSNPPIRVKFGERDVDEMAMAGVQVALFDPSDKLKIYLNRLSDPKETPDK